MARPGSPDSAERLLDAADRLMYARGYNGAGVAELCREADVRPGSFYYYFPSKEALAAVMIERAWRRTRDTIFAEAFPDTATDPRAAVERYAELLEQHLRRLQRQHGVVVGCRFGNFATETSPHHEQVADATAEVFAAMHERFRAVVARGQRHGHVDPGADPDVLADMLVAHMEGLMVLAKATGDPATIRRLGEAAAYLLPVP